MNTFRRRFLKQTPRGETSTMSRFGSIIISSGFGCELQRIACNGLRFLEQLLEVGRQHENQTLKH